jgi:AcrR family transcriptional regulator
MADQVTTTTRRGSKRKAELLAASARLFDQSGYHNVSMDDIAAAVGITGPALYRHFSNKHELLAQALDDNVSSVEAVADRVLTGDADGVARLQLYLDALANVVLDPSKVLLWKRERVHLEADRYAAFRVRMRNVRRQTERIILGWRPELSAADAQLLAWVLLSIYSSTHEYRSGMSQADVAQLLAKMTNSATSVNLGLAPQVHRRTRPERVTPVGRRERVLDAAARLFHEQGYRAVSVEDIAEASETAIATVYQLVSSKANLLHAVLARGSEGTSFLTAHRLALAPEHEAPLDTIVDTYVELARGPHARLFKILASDSVYLEEEAKQSMRRSQREYLEEWTRALLDVRPEITAAEARARVRTAAGVVSETVQIRSVQTRANLQGDLRLIAIAILHS